MIKELQSLISQFQIADRAVEKLSSKVWERFDINELWIEKEIANQYQEYLSAKNAPEFR